MGLLDGKFSVEDQTAGGKGMSELKSKGMYMREAILGDAQKYGRKDMGDYVVENKDGKLVIKEK